MNARGLVSSASLVLAIAATELRAAGGEDVGARVRVRIGSDRSEQKGLLVARDAEQLTLQVGKHRDPVVIPLRQVTELHASRGRARGKAAGIGALAGMVVAGALTLAGARDVGCGSNQSECFCSGEGCLKGFGLLAVPAAAVGALTGALVAPERWRELPIHAPGSASRPLPVGRIAVGVAPMRGGGIGFAATCSF